MRGTNIWVTYHVSIGITRTLKGTRESNFSNDNFLEAGISWVFCFTNASIVNYLQKRLAKALFKKSLCLLSLQLQSDKPKVM